MGEDAQRVCLRVVERKPGPINGQDMLEGLADRVEEPFLGQILNEGIVDLKKRAITLCAGQNVRTHLRSVHGDSLSKRGSRQVFVGQKRALSRHLCVFPHFSSRTEASSSLPQFLIAPSENLATRKTAPKGKLGILLCLIRLHRILGDCASKCNSINYLKQRTQITPPSFESTGNTAIDREPQCDNTRIVGYSVCFS